MYVFQEDVLLIDDREELIALLRLRFGDVPGTVIENIYNITQLDTLQRLILAGANALDWSSFMEEMNAGDDAFRISGGNVWTMEMMLRSKEE